MKRIRPFFWPLGAPRRGTAGPGGSNPREGGLEVRPQDLSSRGTWIPPLDLSETPEEYTVVIEVPGMEPAEIEVTLENRILYLRGEKRSHRPIGEHDHYRIERSYGPFERAVRLPANIDGDGITATACNGLLRVTVPKVPEAQPRRVTVTSGPETASGE